MSSPARADIRIPAPLLPEDGRFGCGPSKIRPDALAALAATGRSYLGTSHRQPPVKSMVSRLRRGLHQLFSLPDGYEVALGNGGTTIFWDIATFGLIERRSEHLVFGEFSGKFADAATAAPHLEDPVIVASEPGTHPEPAADAGVDLYALTHNETSTGVMMDIRRPAADALVAVDATSAAGGLRVEASQFDAYYFAPQKGFASDGGLWVALLSPAAVERAEQLRSRWRPASLDLVVALENSRLDQTVNTPSLATLFLFVDQLEWMLGNGGLEWAAQRCDRSAEILYGWAESTAYATPFVDKPDERSHVVGTVDLDPAVDANAVAKTLRTNGIVDTESYRKLGRNQLRIGMFPAVDPADVEALIACVDYVVAELA